MPSYYSTCISFRRAEEVNTAEGGTSKERGKGVWKTTDDCPSFAAVAVVRRSILCMTKKELHPTMICCLFIFVELARWMEIRRVRRIRAHVMLMPFAEDGIQRGSCISTDSKWRSLKEEEVKRCDHLIRVLELHMVSSLKWLSPIDGRVVQPPPATTTYL